MKIRALRVFGDGKRNYVEGEIAEMEPDLFEKVNATSNGILCELVAEDTDIESTSEEVEEDYVEEKSKEESIEEVKDKKKGSKAGNK